ncbi:hypothetical protein B0O99DRAFT_630188 [Bisporella sp. PMI_857]|nr:hypothetical protein B0O99DRAFT_630188 [Bisporella sp. PMI_857]
MSTTTRHINKDHIPRVPTSLTVIRILQFLIGTTLLGLSAYGIWVYGTSGYDLTLFTSIVTFLFVLYALFTERKLTSGYNYWAILALDLFLIIFWLISFAKTAAEANSVENAFLYFGDYLLRGPTARRWQNVLITCAVLGAFQFMLFIITLFATAYFVHKHRGAGGHSQPHPAPVGNMEENRQMEAHGAIMQPPTSYNQQPVPATGYNAV